MHILILGEFTRKVLSPPPNKKKKKESERFNTLLQRYRFNAEV